MRKSSKAMRLLVPAVAFAFIAAACGDDSGSGDNTTAATVATTAPAAVTTAAPVVTTAPAAVTTAAVDTTVAGGDTTVPETTVAAGPCDVDASIDAAEGVNAGAFSAALRCAEVQPIAAEGEPIVIGIQNPEGDPNGSFPEYSLSVQAAADFINAELGGIGGDVLTGKPGRPIEIELCVMAITPADSQRCANELAGKNPFTVISTLNFFGNHFPIYAQAGVSVIVGTPITVGDFTDPSTFAIGAGGGCLGVHTGLIYAATQPEAGINAKRVAVPWADTPPGVVCYYDLEQKPLEVLKGDTPGTSALAGSIPDLEYIKDGVPIKPAAPDVTPQATQVLAFNPEAIVLSAQGADCWNFVDGLGRQGWTPDAIPLLLSGACIDFDKMTAAGDLAKGIYFVGAAGAALSNPDAITNPRLKLEAITYLTKAAKYGMSETDIKKGFAAQGWSVMMTVWEQAGLAADVTPDAFKAQFKATAGNHIYGSVPFGCSEAKAPYVAVCNTRVSLSQWNGTELVSIIENYSGVDLIAGTELQPGPK